MQKKIAEYLNQALKKDEQRKVATFRLILAALKDREIHNRTTDKREALNEEEIFEILAKMIKQREDSVAMYEKGGRLELAAQEKEEIAIIKTLLPKPLSEEETEKAVQNAILEMEAQSLRDIGKIMAFLKKNYAGKMDFAKAAAKTRQKLEG